jgi:hypothetical protein
MTERGRSRRGRKGLGSIFKREMGMSGRKDHEDEEMAVSPAVEATEVRATAVPVADDQLRDDDGNPKTPTTSREEVRAKRLGAAAAHATFAQRIWDVIAQLRRNVAGHRARLDAAEPRRAITEDEYGMYGQAAANAATIPNCNLDPKRRVVATVPKPGFIIGDTAVMAVVLVRSGAPAWLAVLVGLSMALSTVMAGSQLGQMLTLAAQRRARGPVPEECPLEHRGFYDNGTADADLARWLALGVLTGGALFVSLTLIGVGDGDPPPLAVGFGLLAALTLGGAAATEAYGTNAAAEYRHDLEQHRDRAAERLTEFEDWAFQAAHDDELATSLSVAAEHEAVAAAITVDAIADRTPDTPNIFGYTHPAAPTAVDAFTAPDLPPLGPPSKRHPSGPRPAHRLTNPFGTGSTATNGKQPGP